MNTPIDPRSHFSFTDTLEENDTGCFPGTHSDAAKDLAERLFIRDDREPSLAAAERHLTLLDESTEELLFVRFDDDKECHDKRLTRVFWGTLGQHGAALTRLRQLGAGAFVTVNRTSGASRKQEEITGFRAFWRELDHNDAPPLPFGAHVEIGTSPGKRHEYIFVEDAPAAGHESEDVHARLVTDYGSDPNAKDRSRVLRLAGFHQMKQPTSPHRVRILRESGEAPYPSGRRFSSACHPFPRLRPRQTVWRLEKLHQFPQRVRISNQCVGWKSAEVEAWKASRQSADVMDPSVSADEKAIRDSDEQR